MRGARIAEKIQEYISAGPTSQNNYTQGSKQSSNVTTGGNSVVKMYNGGKRGQHPGVFQLNNKNRQQSLTSHGGGQAARAQQQASEQIEFKGRATSSYGSL